MRNTAMIAASAAALAVSGAAAGLHADDLEEVGDHPMVPRIAGSEVISYDFVEFDDITIPFGRYTSGEWQETVEVEGSHEKFAYVLRQPDTATLPVKRAYQQALEDQGFDIAFIGTGRDDLPRRFGRQDYFSRDFDRRLGSTARIGGDRDNRRFIAARHEGEDLYVTVFFHVNQDDEPIIRVNVVEPGETELGMETVEATAEPETTDGQAGTDQAGMDEAVAERASLSAAEMQDGLIEDGRVAVQDILFEFDSAEIRRESSQALNSIADVMETTPDLQLLVVGHTDDVGDFDYNLQLSMERAQSVAAWLRDEHDIAAGRMQAAGAGMMAPIASNRTEEGRAENRRVELVETRE